ncbi:Sorl1p [Perkinsus olseni]|uniref:Sorl1p n=1 Tax=Perkinsus olseni TaxID=32597 RepID=A0A7J6PHJ1_PEROL|nr:Sorl1p [Perkinsus olseni]
MADATRRTRNVVFSWTEGADWYDFELDGEPFHVNNIITSDSAASTKFLIYGTRDYDSVLYHLDFSSILPRTCSGYWAPDAQSSDYETWIPSAGLISGESCLLGRITSYVRRKPHAKCFNGEKFERPVFKNNCPCTFEDYHCALGFARTLGESECRPVDVDAVLTLTAGWPSGSPSLGWYLLVLTPEEMECTSSGAYFADAYRRVPGDTCEGGFVPPKAQVPCPSFSPLSRAALIASGLIVVIILLLIGMNRAAAGLEGNGGFETLRYVKYATLTRAGRETEDYTSENEGELGDAPSLDQYCANVGRSKKGDDNVVHHNIASDSEESLDFDFDDDADALRLHGDHQLRQFNFIYPMKSPAHVMALEVKYFEGLMNERGRRGDLPEIFGHFCAGLTKTQWALAGPEGELLLNPPPSYIFVMNEDLCGVYPTPTGVYIRKPLERGEEVMVLQPGFQGTKAVYYYHNNKSQLFVLCEDNRKLIIYDLRASPERPGVTSEVLGLPGLATCYSRKMDMVSNDDYIFILIATGHLFYINRRDIRDSVQAYRGWLAHDSQDGCGHLLLDPRRPWALRVFTVAFDVICVVDLALSQHPHRSGHPKFRETKTRQVPFATSSSKRDVVTVVPIEPGLCSIVLRRADCRSKRAGAHLQLANEVFRLRGMLIPLTGNYREAYHMQILSGPADAVYVMRRDTSFSVQTFFNHDEDDEEKSVVSESVMSDISPDEPKRLTIYRYYTSHAW